MPLVFDPATGSASVGERVARYSSVAGGLAVRQRENPPDSGERKGGASLVVLVRLFITANVVSAVMLMVIVGFTVTIVVVVFVVVIIKIIIIITISLPLSSSSSSSSSWSSSSLSSLPLSSSSSSSSSSSPLSPSSSSSSSSLLSSSSCSSSPLSSSSSLLSSSSSSPSSSSSYHHLPHLHHHRRCCRCRCYDQGVANETENSSCWPHFSLQSPTGDLPFPKSAPAGSPASPLAWVPDLSHRAPPLQRHGRCQWRRAVREVWNPGYISTKNHTFTLQLFTALLC